MYTFDYNGQQMTCLDKAVLQHGAYYRGTCRNAVADLARWDNTKQEFIYIRHKWGEYFTEAICHPEDEQHYDVFCVQELVENPSFVIPDLDQAVDVKSVIGKSQE